MERAASRNASPLHASSPEGKKKTMKQVTWRIIAVCLTAVVISVNDTNYGPLIPILQQHLRLSGGQVALLLSTPFFAGMVLSSLIGGGLADRYSVRTMMLGSLLPLTIGEILLPLPPPSLPPCVWMGIMRGVVGLGAGVAFVSSARSMSLLGQYAGLGQGVNVSAGVLGPALGLAVTPLFCTSFGWRGAFVVWGLAGAGAYVIWSWMPDTPSVASTEQLPCHPLAVWRCVPGWALGLTFMGTAGLGNAIFAWLPVYFVGGYHLSLTLAAGIGAIGLLAGTLCRPLGGLVLDHLPSLTIIRASTLATGLGICLLALPITSVPVACLGVLLLAFGTTTPQAAIFNTVAEVGERYGLGRGLAQGMILVATAPALCAASLLIGLFLEHTGSFTAAFGVTDFLFGGTAVLASWCAGPLLAGLGMDTVGRQHMRGVTSRSQEVRTIVLHQATLLG